jgi:hypothetical protein
MIKRKTYFRHKADFVSDELVEALLAKTSYDFHDLFRVIYDKLRARNAASGGEEMLRLRVYEKLQMLVAQGLVKKDGKSYSAVKAGLRVRSAEMAAAKAAAEARKTATVLHSE